MWLLSLAFNWKLELFFSLKIIHPPFSLCSIDPSCNVLFSFRESKIKKYLKLEVTSVRKSMKVWEKTNTWKQNYDVVQMGRFYFQRVLLILTWVWIIELVRSDLSGLIPEDGENFDKFLRTVPSQDLAGLGQPRAICPQTREPLSRLLHHLSWHLVWSLHLKKSSSYPNETSSFELDSFCFFLTE